MSSNTTEILQPGISIKPKVNHKDVEEVLGDVYGLKCLSAKELNGYDDSNYLVKVADKCDNQYVNCISEDGYVLKIVNSLDSKKPQIFEAQNELLLYLDKQGICCPQPVRNKQGQYYVIQTFKNGNHVVRLLEFIPGLILHQITSTDADLFYQTGEYLAKLDEAMKDFHHSAFDTHITIWMLQSVPQLSQFLYVITDEPRKKIVKEVIEEFEQKVLSRSHQLEKGMIHGDFNEQNILVEERDGSWSVKGILDFGDTNKGCYLYELAITMTYMMLQGKSTEVGRQVLSGYNSVRKLPSEEYKLLRTCVAGRLCQSLVLGVYSSLQDPDNSYILTTAKPGWALLEELWSQPEEKILDLWLDKRT